MKEEASFSDVLVYIKKHMKLFMISILFFIGVQTVYYIYTENIVYKAESSILLSMVQEGDSEISEEEFEELFLLNLKKVETFAELLTSDQVLEKTAAILEDEYGYSLNKQSLREAIFVESTSRTQILSINVIGTDKLALIDISNALLTAFDEFVTEELKHEQITILSIANSETIGLLNKTSNFFLLLIFRSILFAVLVVHLMSLYSSKKINEEFINEELGYMCLGSIEEIR